MSATARRPMRRVCVLESTAAPGATVKYIDQVVRHAPSAIEFKYFSWRIALLDAYDVFHVHWPEALIRSRSPLKRKIQELLFRLLARRLRRRRIPVVRTAHNHEPHARGHNRESRLLRRLDGLTTRWVALNGCDARKDTSTEHIPHGHYRDSLGQYPAAKPVPGRVLTIGRIEPYKGVTELVDLYATTRPDAMTLRIVGAARQHLAAEIQAVAAHVDGITTRFEFVSDRELVHEVTSAELVVLPYREMNNSGMLLVALSLDRPVLVPRSCVNVEIAGEVGGRWVHLYDGELTVEHIERALAGSRARPERRPNLEGRDWRIIAQRYADAFAAVAGSA